MRFFPDHDCGLHSKSFEKKKQDGPRQNRTPQSRSPEPPATVTLAIPPRLPNVAGSQRTAEFGSEPALIRQSRTRSSCASPGTNNTRLISDTHASVLSCESVQIEAKRIKTNTRSQDCIRVGISYCDTSLSLYGMQLSRDLMQPMGKPVQMGMRLVWMRHIYSRSGLTVSFTACELY